MEFYNNSSPSLKQRFKSTFCTCFSHHDVHVPHRYSHDNTMKPSFQRTSSHGSKHAELDVVQHDIDGCTHHHESHGVDVMKEKCKNFISRIGGSGAGSSRHHQGHKRRHSTSADFRYDALSYSLNFDEGLEDERLDEFPLKSFASRLPATPPREHKVLANEQIVALS